MKRALSILLAAGLLAGCGGGDDGPAAGEGTANGAESEGGGVQVAMEGIAYAPTDVEVRVGQPVTWTNNDEVMHDVIASGGEFESELFGEGETYSFTPTEPGTIDYVCSIHPNMMASITVVE
ncbi:MAG: plastocyanin/azurin family copper-binding protein [Solirubrobacteraceae bacterium MAG38_C4-C5]|nr:plastocyanin/azurin family copper-binding protein [Candidatus Siliceabacter maunaloa]